MIKNKDLLIIIPAFNEEGNLPTLFSHIQEAEIHKYADVLVIDDASTDGTAQVVRKHGHRVVSQLYHVGYCGALQLGYRFAKRNGYSYLIQMDGDGQHDVCNIPVIYDKLKEKDNKGLLADVILGERFVPGAKMYHISFLKKVAMNYFSKIIRLTVGLDIPDPTSGLQGMSYRAIDYCSRFGTFDSQDPDANMIIQMHLHGLRIDTVPAVMHRRVAGKSMHSNIEPVIYMFRMTYCILAVLFRFKILKQRAEIIDDQ